MKSINDNIDTLIRRTELNINRTINPLINTNGQVIINDVTLMPIVRSTYSVVKEFQYGIN